MSFKTRVFLMMRRRGSHSPSVSSDGNRSSPKTPSTPRTPRTPKSPRKRIPKTIFNFEDTPPTNNKISNNNNNNNNINDNNNKYKASKNEETASDCNYLLLLKDPVKIKLSNQILDILLDNIIFGYKTLYHRVDYGNLLDQIYQLVYENRIMKFFVPAFPVKSSNKDLKVLGDDVDFAESIALDKLLSVARKIEGIYDAGVKIIIMSDYHTFDKYIQVDEVSYQIYHDSLKQMIVDKGGDDVIQFINLSYFKQFENVPERKISIALAENYGGNTFRESFHEDIKTSPGLLKKYTQQKKFFKMDLSHFLKRSTNSKRKQMLKEIATGMIAQGHALDIFLKQQKCITHYIRLSIHQHHPESGKFAIDLFKNKCRVSDDVQLRTPWHNTVIFDTRTGLFYVDAKEKLTKLKQQGDNKTIEVLVHFQGRPYLYVILHLTKHISQKSLGDIQISMIKHSCGMVVEVPKSNGVNIHIFSSKTIKNLVKEFGVIMFRGFIEFEDEDDFQSYYEDHLNQKSLKWSFGVIHKIVPDNDMPGYVNSHDGIPVHWDMVAPPKYMGVDQTIHRYEDYVCPTFALYCRGIDRLDHGGGEGDSAARVVDTEGATTFIDATAVVQSLHGRTINEWKQIHLKYETELAEKKKDEEEGSDDRQVYFGGAQNTYAYPLIHQCPDQVDKDVLRWWQNWPKNEYPNAKQHNGHTIVSCPDGFEDLTSQEIEEEVRKVAFDHRFFFIHQYEKGDLVFVNNNTTLHGRNRFDHPQRELWRIQTLPDSDNVPEYFKNL